jgi:UDP-glucose 4-epimerase
MGRLMTYKGKRVLCTGGLGFVGSNLVRRLIKEGAQVTILDDLFTGDLNNLNGLQNNKDYFFIQGTVDDPFTVNLVSQQQDIIFHLAARNIIASTKDPLSDYKTNIGGTLNILMAMKEQRMVYTSSASVYGNPRYLPINEDDSINILTPYAASKYGGESYCAAFHESFKLPVVVLRLSNVYGTYQSPKNPYSGVIAKFLSKAKEGQPIEIHGDGLSTRDFTYVDDVVEALMLTGLSEKAEGEVFNIATGIETSVGGLAFQCADLYIENYSMNTESRVEYIDRRDIDSIRRRVLNVEKARKKLNWYPATTLEKGLLKTKEWLEGTVGK